VALPSGLIKVRLAMSRRSTTNEHPFSFPSRVHRTTIAPGNSKPVQCITNPTKITTQRRDPKTLKQPSVPLHQTPGRNSHTAFSSTQMNAHEKLQGKSCNSNKPETRGCSDGSDLLGPVREFRQGSLGFGLCFLTLHLANFGKYYLPEDRSAGSLGEPTRRT